MSQIEDAFGRKKTQPWQALPTVKQPTADTGAPVVKAPTSLEEYYAQAIALSESKYRTEQSNALAAASRSRKTLEQQLEDQRMNYMQGLGVASQDSFQRGRGLINQLAGRGLATSGLLQLGDVQGKLATGATLSSLGEQNRQVQEAGMEAGQGIESNLQQQLVQSGQTMQAGKLTALGDKYDREQAALDRKLQLAFNVIEVAGLGNDKTTDLVGKLSAATTEAEIDAILQEASSGAGGLAELLSSTDAIKQNLGEENIKRVQTSNQYRAGIVMTNKGIPIDISAAVTKNESRIGYQVDQEKASEIIKNRYKNLGHYNEINVVYKPMRGYVFQVVGDTKSIYQTWNDAIEAIEGKKG